jgi:opacity protein-like surface antigen
MKKGAIAVCATILGVILMAAPGMTQEPAKKFAFKLSGGYGSLGGGDLPVIFEGINELLQNVAQLVGGTVSGELENAKGGPEFGGEVIYNLTGRLGIGLGVEYIRKSIIGQTEMRVGTLARVLFGWEPVFEGVPFTLNGHYHLPITSKLSGFVRAGVGYYFATMNYKTREENEVMGVVDWSENVGTAKKSGLGFQGGLGLEYSVSGNIALFIEGGGRYVNLKDWDVDNTHRSIYGIERETGTTYWYVMKYNADTGKYYPTFELGDEKPSGPFIKNARKAEISLSGITFKLGVKFGF